MANVEKLMNLLEKKYGGKTITDESKDKIREIANKHNLGDQSVIAQTIDNNFRVNLGVDKSFKILQEKKNILLEIEIKLKKLDNTLEVFIDEQLDKNIGKQRNRAWYGWKIVYEAYDSEEEEEISD